MITKCFSTNEEITFWNAFLSQITQWKFWVCVCGMGWRWGGGLLGRKNSCQGVWGEGHWGSIMQSISKVKIIKIKVSEWKLIMLLASNTILGFHLMHAEITEIVVLMWIRFHCLFQVHYSPQSLGRLLKNYLPLPIAWAGAPWRM